MLGGCASAEGKASMLETRSGFGLCLQYFQNKNYGFGRSQEWRYENYKRLINEIDSRNLDCRKFPDFDNKEDWMRDRVKKYEQDGSW